MGFGKRGREGEEGAETEADEVPALVPGTQTTAKLGERASSPPRSPLAQRLAQD